MNATTPPDLSICMVSLDCWSVLEPCLASLLASRPRVTYEVVVVDNASTDGTPERLAELFPWVRVIRNERNVGFTRATNQGIRASSGRLVLWLNTDTLLREGSLDELCRFLDQHPRVGIVGPKVLNPDGSFQAQCRRGLPTPLVSLAYLSGLHRLAPQSRVLGGYMLTYLPMDEAGPVDAVSGCCLLARREVWDTAGPLDEAIFGFGEDVDWCVRASRAGWEVWYDPASVIVHLKGQGGVHSKPYHKAWGIHQAMWVFYRKHLRSRYPLLLAGVVWLGIAGSFVASVARVWIGRHFTAGRQARAAG